MPVDVVVTVGVKVSVDVGADLGVTGSSTDILARCLYSEFLVVADAYY